MENKSETNYLIVVQARMGSSRLPGKVLLDLEGEPLLVRMIERVSRIRTPAQIVVATTTDHCDDSIVDVCAASGINVFRGHPGDLLDRHYQAALQFGADVIAKIPSDCPLIDPDVIDQVFNRYMAVQSDYTSNLHPASYPDGNDTELIKTPVLETAWRNAKLPMEREHTTPYIWERPESFSLSNVLWESEGIGISPRDYSMSHRWTIDYPEDYAFIRRIYAELYPCNKDFSLYDILDLLDQKPEIHAINAKYAGVNWYRDYLAQLKTINLAQTRII